MAQQYNPNAQNIKVRNALLVFLKGATAPLVLYVKDVHSLYEELIQKMANPKVEIIQKATEGPIKKVCFFSNQIAALAIQEEQFMQR